MESNCDKYGRLYDWHTAKSACPAGWHLPTRREWNNLSRAAGGKWGYRSVQDKHYHVGDEYYTVWEAAGAKLKAKSGWMYHNGESGSGSDDYGFSALPGGKSNIDGGFRNAGFYGYWWTSQRRGDNHAYVRYMSNEDDREDELSGYTSSGFSVRCAGKPVRKRVWKEYKRMKDGENALAEEAKRGKAGQIRLNIERLSGYFTDSRDGRRYRTVETGGRVWMAQNLSYLPPAGESWCYGDDSANCAQYGRLYDWSAAKAACPTGWHLPAIGEWDSLAAAAGDTVAGRALKSAEGWKYDGGGEDGYGFSALPGGFRYSDGKYINLGSVGSWWTATAHDEKFAYLRFIYHDRDKVVEGFATATNVGISVRCAKDF
jgi:uncharacterized protein (TIGR02145 family)